MAPPTYPVHDSTFSGPTLADEIARRIKEREQQRVLCRGTHSLSNWRYDARAKAPRQIAFVEEPDTQGERVIARCTSVQR